MRESSKGNEKPKMSGSDGITIEFYKLFWKEIREYYLKSINFSFQNIELTELQKQGTCIITLLPKTGK